MRSSSRMSGAATIERAAAGGLPAWARASERRRAHIARVAALMDGWCATRGGSAPERARWRAAAWLHDALRDAEPESLRPLVPASLRDAAAPLLHGPAAAELLRRDGVADAAILAAVAYHTIGSPDLDPLGRALYVADFVEPGRTFAPLPLARLRARMPADLDAVAADVVSLRIRHRLDRGALVRSETVAFWNRLVAERAP